MKRPQAESGAAQTREGRVGALTSVSALLGRVTPDHGVDWHTIVGAMLGGLTVPVGVNDAGVLRVMAVNETAQRELEARGEAVLDLWNQASRDRDGVSARTLQCWVRPGLRPRNPVALKAESTLPERVIPPECVADAETMTGPVEDAGVRAALVQMRAKALASGRGEKEKSDEQA